MSTAQMSLWGGETAGDLVTEIEQNGYGLIEHGISADLIDALQAAQADFSENLPDPEPATLNAMMINIKDLDDLDFSKDTQKEWHKYRTNTPHFAKPNGYTNRFYQAKVLNQFERPVLNKKSGEWEPIQEDPKEFFHFTPDFQAKMTNRHKEFNWGPIPPEVNTLAMRLNTVHALARKAMTKVFYDLEIAHPGLHQYVTPKDLLISPVRNLLYYKGQGDVLAGGHHDRGIFTMQIAESHLGLRIRDPKTEEMIPVDTADEVSPVFPALKWNTTFEGSPLRSLWHDVINMPEASGQRQIHGNNIARWAMIFFINSQKIGEAVNKSATHHEAVMA